MPSDTLRQATAAFHAEFARQLGCETSAFSAPGLTVCERPVNGREPHLVILAECGVGTVVSTKTPELLPWLREKGAALPFHFRVFQPSFLEALAAEASRVGHERARTHGSTMGLILAEELTVPPLPKGLRIVELTPDEILAERPTEVFDNALLDPDERTEMLARFRTAFGVKDGDGRLLGVSGVWDQYPGIDEIGVDVLREARGQGLARMLTIHATRWIRQQDRWPIYTAGMSNLRSINNGIACGFRPAWMLTVVYVPMG